MSPDHPSILFVDDEPSILKTLRRLFMEEDWNLLFATSGPEGLEILAREPVDLVVSDFRMPGMDGAAFLRLVKERYPHVVRIFLSGYADRHSVTQALAEGCARQILPKPWEETALQEVITAALTQSRAQQQRHAKLQELLNTLPALPALPQTYTELRSCLADREGFSAERVAEIARQDVSLCTTMLHWANSALFGQMQQVDTVKRAIVVLGMDIVEGLFLSSLLAESFGPGAARIPGFDYAGLQRHSVASATLARLLVDTRQQPSEMADRAFTAALIHDVGKLVEAHCLAEGFAAVVRQTRVDKALLLEAEQTLLGVTHEDLGGYLAGWWDLPEFLTQAVRWHHDPAGSAGHREIVETVHLANALVQQFGFGRSGNHRLPQVQKAVWERYPLSAEQLKELRVATERGMPGQPV